MIARPRTTPFVVLLATALSGGVITGCSSSSSGGSGGPPAASSETFHNVTPRANRLIQKTVALMPGVASVTYQGSDLVVRFRSTALKVDQTNVENVVHEDQQAAATSPSPTRSAKKM